MMKSSVFVGSLTEGKTSGNCTGNLIPFKVGSVMFDFNCWDREIQLNPLSMFLKGKILNFVTVKSKIVACNTDALLITK